MSLRYDPEFFQVFEPLIPLLSNRPKLAVKDIPSSREARDAGIATFLRHLPDLPDVDQKVHEIAAPDGYHIEIYGFTKKSIQTQPGPALIHYHGGGMTIGSAQLYAKSLASLVSQTSIPIFSVNYRLAPEHNGTTLVEDCLAALVWLSQNAQMHNVDPARIALFGESAGGGLAAGVALMARDMNLQPPIAKQILVYPMIDDRSLVPNKAMEPFAFFRTEDNITSWTAVLGDKAGRPDADVSPYSAPARAHSLAGLPSTYIDVGSLDIFRDEDVLYATRLLAENVETELHVYPGVPHAFELLAPNISITRQAHENRLRAMMSF